MKRSQEERKVTLHQSSFEGLHSTEFSSHIIEKRQKRFTYRTPFTPVKKNNLWPSPSLIGGDKHIKPPVKVQYSIRMCRHIATKSADDPNLNKVR